MPAHVASRVPDLVERRDVHDLAGLRHDELPDEVALARRARAGEPIEDLRCQSATLPARLERTQLVPSLNPCPPYLGLLALQLARQIGEQLRISFEDTSGASIRTPSTGEWDRDGLAGDEDRCSVAGSDTRAPDGIRFEIVARRAGRDETVREWNDRS